MPGKMNARKEVCFAHSLRVQFIMAEKQWWRELEAADHMTSAARQQRQMATFLLSVSPRLKPMEWHC